jgi:hypothetical protein
MIESQNRDSLLGAMSVIELIEIGWRPGQTELANARHVVEWAILPSEGEVPYRIMGLAQGPGSKTTTFVAAVIAIDFIERWAWIWDEWIVIGNQIPWSPRFDPTEIRRTAAAWLLDELRRLSVSA